MKTYKRAYRRYKKWIKFKKRVDQWTNYWSPDPVRQYKADILAGRSCTWLKTTARPCNCFGCSGANKYVRPKKQDVLKEVWEEIADVAQW